MDFVEGVCDMGAAEMNVTGIAAVERISKGQVRVTYFICRKGERLAAAIRRSTSRAPGRPRHRPLPPDLAQPGTWFRQQRS
jgi:hypothetical protein